MLGHGKWDAVFYDSSLHLEVKTRLQLSTVCYLTSPAWQLSPSCFHSLPSKMATTEECRVFMLLLERWDWAIDDVRHTYSMLPKPLLISHVVSRLPQVYPHTITDRHPVYPAPASRARHSHPVRHRIPHRFRGDTVILCSIPAGRSAGILHAWVAQDRS